MIAQPQWPVQPRISADEDWNCRCRLLETAQAQKPDVPEIAAQIEQARKVLAYPTA